MQNYSEYTSARDLIIDVYKTHCQECITFFQKLTPQESSELLDKPLEMDITMSKVAFEHTHHAAVVMMEVMSEIAESGNLELYDKVVALNYAPRDELEELGKVIAEYMGQDTYTTMSKYSVLVADRVQQRILVEQHSQAE